MQGEKERGMEGTEGDKMGRKGKEGVHAPQFEILDPPLLTSYQQSADASLTNSRPSRYNDCAVYAKRRYGPSALSAHDHMLIICYFTTA